MSRDQDVIDLRNAYAAECRLAWSWYKSGRNFPPGDIVRTARQTDARQKVYLYGKLRRLMKEALQ